MMQYLYHGGVRGLAVAAEDVLELLGAAHFFMLDGLQRHCEVLCSQRLTPASCTSIYKHAKVSRGERREILRWERGWKSELEKEGGIKSKQIKSEFERGRELERDRR